VSKTIKTKCVLVLGYVWIESKVLALTHTHSIHVQTLTQLTMSRSHGVITCDREATVLANDAEI